MHSPSLRCSVVALGLIYLTVIVFYLGELHQVGSDWACGREGGDDSDSPFGCKLKVHFISDELQYFNMKNHSLRPNPSVHTHRLWGAFLLSLRGLRAVPLSNHQMHEGSRRIFEPFMQTFCKSAFPQTFAAFKCNSWARGLRHGKSCMYMICLVFKWLSCKNTAVRLQGRQKLATLANINVTVGV